MLRISFVRLIVALGAVFVVACEHGEPFRSDEGGPTGPLLPGSPARLTYSPGQDLVPVWLPDGTAFVYSAERRDRADRDRCLAFMPADGGTISQYVCRTSAPDDSINVFDEAAFSGDSVAYVRASTERFLPGLGPDLQELVVAPLSDPNAVRVLQRIPFTTPWGDTYDAISHVAWIRPGRLAFIGEHVTYPRACRSCAPDTVRIGVGAALVDIAGPAPVFTRMPDGDSASSLAVGANGDTIYFTRFNDSRVYGHALASASTDTLIDFGAAGAVRDIAVDSGRLAAIVGGFVAGPGAPDRGGALYLVQNQIVARIDDRLYRRPALSPDRLVVSAWDGVFPVNTDLWLFQFR